MSRLIPFGNIPDSSLLPDGIFRLKLAKVEAVMTASRDGKASKLMYKTMSQVIEPKSHAGLMYFEQFVIGTEDDPEAEELSTWQTSFGARNWKKLCAKTNVPYGDEEDEDTYLANLKGAEYLATVIQKVEPDKLKNGEDNPYKGRVNNQTTAFWSIGEKDAVLTNGHDKPKAAPRGPRATTTTTDPKAAPSDTVKCSACPPDAPKVARKALAAHVKQHMDDMQQQAGDDE